jgi:hypothetical protein
MGLDGRCEPTPRALGVEMRWPPPNCRVVKSLNQEDRWVPGDFFRLFCASRTCAPKPVPAPFYFCVGSKHIFQSRTWQGSHPLIIGTPIVASFGIRGYQVFELPVNAMYPNYVDTGFSPSRFSCVSRASIKYAERCSRSSSNSRCFLFNSKYSLVMLSAANNRMARLSGAGTLLPHCVFT